MIDLYRTYQRAILRKRLCVYLLIALMLILILNAWGKMQEHTQTTHLATLLNEAQIIHKQKCLPKKPHTNDVHKNTTISVNQLLSIVIQTVPHTLSFDELMIKPNHIFMRGQYEHTRVVTQYLQKILRVFPSKKQYRLTFVNTKQFTVLIHSTLPKKTMSLTQSSPSLLATYHQLLLQEIEARHIQIQKANLLGPNKIELIFLANFASSLHILTLLSQRLGEQSCLFIHLKHGPTRTLLKTRILCQWH